MREAQIYVKTKFLWKKNRFEVETKYLPSVYVAKLTIEIPNTADQEEKDALQESLLLIFEEKLKLDFKRHLEDTEEREGFLETGSLNKLSDKLARYVERSTKRYAPKSVWTAID